MKVTLSLPTKLKLVNSVNSYQRRFFKMVKLKLDGDEGDESEGESGIDVHVDG